MARQVNVDIKGFRDFVESMEKMSTQIRDHYSKAIQNLAQQMFQAQMGMMARISDVASLLSTGRPQDLQQVLIACILRAEDECLTLVDSDVSAAKSYTLVVTAIPEEHGVVLTVRPR